MILVWNNGKEFSGKEIWFIELYPNENTNEIMQLIEAFQTQDDFSRVEATIKEMEWCVFNRTATIYDWLENRIYRLVTIMKYRDKNEYMGAHNKIMHLPIFWRKQIANSLKKAATNTLVPKWGDEAKKVAEDLENFK